jgi:hypothetical protein
MERCVGQEDHPEIFRPKHLVSQTSKAEGTLVWSERFSRSRARGMRDGRETYNKSPYGRPQQ